MDLIPDFRVAHEAIGESDCKAVRSQSPVAEAFREIVHRLRFSSVYCVALFLIGDAPSIVDAEVDSVKTQQQIKRNLRFTHIRQTLFFEVVIVLFVDIGRGGQCPSLHGSKPLGVNVSHLRHTHPSLVTIGHCSSQVTCPVYYLRLFSDTSPDPAFVKIAIPTSIHRFPCSSILFFRSLLCRCIASFCLKCLRAIPVFAST